MKLFAYIDPGVGALIWQSVVAGVVGFLFYLKKTRRWIVGVFRKMFGRGQKSSSAAVKIPAVEKAAIESDAR
jgi:O-antigen/teichoic acid export membrane protein